MIPISDRNFVAQTKSAVVEVSLDGSSTAEVQRVAQEEVLASVGNPLSSEKGELTSERNTVPDCGQRQPAVSEDSPEERDVAEVETTVEEKASQSEEKSVAVDPPEPLVSKATGDQEMKDRCDTVTDQTKLVPGDLTSSEPVSS